MSATRLALFLALTLAAAVNCNGPRVTDSAPRAVPPRDSTTRVVSSSVLATFTMGPPTVVMSQGDGTRLRPFAWDQYDRPMWIAGLVTFTSTDSTVATVSDSGLVTAVGAGLAEIRANLTLQGVTRIARVEVTSLDTLPRDSVVVTSGDGGWQPSIARVLAGGTVRFSTRGIVNWAGEPHGKIYFLSSDYMTTLDSLVLSSGSVTRKFSAVGEHRYCSGGCWDPPDFGLIRVFPSR